MAASPSVADASWNLVSTLREGLRRQPGAPAVIHIGGAISHRQLWAAVDTLAARLRAEGCVPGEVVGVSLPQAPLHLAFLLALAQVGAVTVTLHPMLPQAWRQKAARSFGVARVALQDPQMALPGLPVFRLDDVTVDDRTASAPGPVAAVLPEALCRIAFSSGTSGDPKGMAMSHRLLALRVQHNSDAQAGNSRLLPMDINFGAGLIPALVTLSVGGAVLFPAGMEIGALCETALVLGATHWDIAPAQGESLAALITTDGPRLPSLLALRVFGGHIAPRLQELLRRRITPQITTAYGTTETGFLSLADAQTLARHPDSVGRIPPWAEVQVVDTGNRPLPPGQQGRLRLRAEGMVSGYWHDPEATARRFQDGWYVPGDLGRVDAEGLLYIAGREDDVLNVGGLKVNPDEVEAALCAHAAVVEAGAFAHVLADGREILAAALVLGSGGTLDAVQAHARTALGPFAPAAYVLARQLPRTPSGKLQRHRLAELISPAGTPAS